jgi:spore germination cell wall hydrolase CwlJ-like protein
MRRLLEWLNVSHIVSGTAHVAVGLFCLTVVGGALTISYSNSDAASAAMRTASANKADMSHHVVSIAVGPDAQATSNTVAAAAPVSTASASDDVAHSDLVPAVFRGSDASTMMLGDAVVNRPALKIKLTDLERERRCLVEGIYYEARGERAVGQVAVAEVVLNRVMSGRYPATICGVVFQGAKSGQCQFSFACSNVMKHPRNKVAWRKAQRLAHYVLAGKIHNSLVGTATYYHATYVNPYWAPHMVEVAKIGQHIFYRSAADGLGDPQS